MRMGNLFMSRHSSSRTHSPTSDEIDFSWFTILRSIGRGSYGKVCIAKKKDTQKLYAMKYMDKLECIKEGAVSNILQELKLLKLIHHPHIVNLRYAFHDVEDMCLVVDLLQGGDLRYHLNKMGGFGEGNVIIYMLEIGAALEYLHSLAIIHRDVKPDNLLLGLDGHIHLTDFNIATQLKNFDLAHSQCGTWHYMAPEIFLSSLGKLEGYSYPVDWWSLGVTCYELFHGQVPFDVPRSTSKAAALYSHLPNARYSSRLSQSFSTVFQALLRVDETKRLVSLEGIENTLSVSYQDVLSGNLKPDFFPSLKKLNVDPSYELEELIIESKPIHKKQSRLSKTASADGSTINSTQDANSEILALIAKEFEPFDHESRPAAVTEVQTSALPDPSDNPTF
ncbi:serine/threonine-protein kinase 32B-like [Watersipora subatra]|uniref:serine/threonine-protein kinase 32B-like n=1 Tax=Watersipora subatra TaxID=2589382 RepID=UPI00355C1621